MKNMRTTLGSHLPMKMERRCGTSSMHLFRSVKPTTCLNPFFWEEEDGRELVIGFRVNGQPQFILSDAQYSKKENGAPLMMMMTDATKFFMETGEQVSFVGYVGFDDVCRGGEPKCIVPFAPTMVSTSHDELNAVGFDAKELWNIFQHTVIRPASLW